MALNGNGTGHVDLEGLHAIVTGGSSGIGLIIAEILLESGASVSILNTNPDTAATAIASLKAKNPSYEVHSVQCDVSDYASVLSAFDACFSKYNRLDIVISNAGINREQQPFRDFLAPAPTSTSQPPLRTLEVNLLGCLHTIYAGLSYMRKSGRGGSILCTSSTAGIYPFPFAPIYAASKHAIVGLVRSAALSLEAEGITLNAITPSIIRSNLAPAEVFEGMIETPPSVLAEAVKELITNRSLTGKIAEVGEEGEHGCLFVDPPPFPNEMTKYNLEQFLKLGRSPRYGGSFADV